MQKSPMSEFQKSKVHEGHRNLFFITYLCFVVHLIKNVGAHDYPMNNDKTQNMYVVPTNVHQTEMYTILCIYTIYTYRYGMQKYKTEIYIKQKCT